MTSKQRTALLLGGLLTILVVLTLLAFRPWQFESPDDFAEILVAFLRRHTCAD